MNEITGGPVTVLKARTQSQIAMAKSILDAAAIPYVVQGEALQQLWGINMATGFVEIQVPEGVAQEARDLLRSIE